MDQQRGSSHLRPTTREVEDSAREQRNKRRIFRIQQVREQARQQAQRVREACSREDARLQARLEEQLLASWQQQHHYHLDGLQQEYQESLRHLGEAHRKARLQPDAEVVLAAQGRHNQQVAHRRGREAFKCQREEQRLEQHHRQQQRKHRHDALNWERQRASRVANLPTPEAFRKKREEPQREVGRVLLLEAGTFTTSAYVPRPGIIQREEGSHKPSAKDAAVVEELRETEQQASREEEQAKQEQLREERGKEALSRERLQRLYQHMVEKLDQAQRNHQLSTYLQGTDVPSFTTEEAREQAASVVQNRMEKVAEKLLEEDKTEAALDLTPSSASDASQSLEVVDSSQENQVGIRNTTSDLKAFLEEIRRRRERVLHGVREDLTEVADDGDDQEEEPRPPSPPHSTTGSPSHHSQDESSIHRPDEVEGDGDIHLAETVPAHLHPGFPAASVPRRPGGEGNNRGLEQLPPPQPSEQTSSLSFEDSGPGSTEYLSPPSSLPCHTRREPQDGGRDIHLAATTPVHLVAGSHREPHVPHDHEPFQESESDDIKINIDVSGSSSWKTVPSDEVFHLRPPGSSLTGIPGESVRSTTSPTINPSAPFPPSQGFDREMEDNLQRIQENRDKIQRTLNALSQKKLDQHSSLLSSTSPGSIYTEKMKGEGTGKRPLKKREKYDSLKREIVQHYLKKLLDMDEDKVRNVSASSVEGSGISVSSLGSLIDTMRREEEEWSPSTTPTSHASHYEGIDVIPVRLSSIPSSNSDSTPTVPSTGSQESGEGSSEHEVQRQEPQAGWPVEHSSLSGSSRQEGGTRGLPSLPTLRFPPPLPTDQNLDRKKQIEECLARLQNWKEQVGLTAAETISNSATSGMEAAKKVTFGMPQPGVGLSTIYEGDDSTTDHHRDGGSASYQTPPREYESSLNDTASHSSVCRPWDLPPSRRVPPCLSSTEEEEDKRQVREMGGARKYYTAPLQYREKHGVGPETQRPSYFSAPSLQCYPSVTSTPPTRLSQIPHPPSQAPTVPHPHPPPQTRPLPGPDDVAEAERTQAEGDTSTVFLPLASESTLTSSLSPSPPQPTAAGDNRQGSSESVTSLPDMAEVLHRFGLPWAHSMIRKMERTEQHFSDSSITPGT